MCLEQNIYLATLFYLQINTVFQHPVALCRSDFVFWFYRLCATTVNVHPSSLYCNSHTCFGLIDHPQVYKLCA
jgi:hypothetical protein